MWCGKAGGERRRTWIIGSPAVALKCYGPGRLLLDGTESIIR